MLVGSQKQIITRRCLADSTSVRRDRFSPSMSVGRTVAALQPALWQQAENTVWVYCEYDRILHTTACRATGMKNATRDIEGPKRELRKYALFRNGAYILLKQQYSNLVASNQRDTCLQTRCSTRRRMRLSHRSTLCLPIPVAEQQQPFTPTYDRR